MNSNTSSNGGTSTRTTVSPREPHLNGLNRRQNARPALNPTTKKGASRPTPNAVTMLAFACPPEYRGKNIKEHKEFIWACELVFRESPVFI
ncbi:hypothetical protein VC83_09281 [Pseudogymnoascus destructans]|uniref:Uncharacterized protein n=2 Tax=Pseudogymnoascus destructans TaxID=655981 RepID=L8FWT1_PSED2|nr:uncharacterized protein VC83_09281 [Pseudogymnoascus destructans]ELR05357.1 hypothetical protein GMDG_07340 [Pseudogymnoascus destructans 20631-21]OAF54413.1 hypothetical protein VC83_09281 [Pseudogymnoascus destructans]